MSEPVRVIREVELVAADPTAGMLRKKAFELPILWAGRVETAPGAISGWHHHDLNETSLYVVSGILRLEFEGGEGYLDAMPGDFIHVPAFLPHMEINPSDSEPFRWVVVRSTSTPIVVNLPANTWPQATEALAERGVDRTDIGRIGDGHASR